MNSGLLGGLRSNPNATAAAKGMAGQAQAELGMEQAKGDMDLGMQRMQQSSQERMQRAQLGARRGQNDAQARMQQEGLRARKANFDLGMGFNYASLQRQGGLQWRQALLNNLVEG